MVLVFYLQYDKVTYGKGKGKGKPKNERGKMMERETKETERVRERGTERGTETGTTTKNERGKMMENRICKHGLTMGFCGFCNPAPKEDTEPETEGTETTTKTEPKTMSKEVWEKLNQKPKPETESVLIQSYKEILDSLDKIKTKKDRNRKGKKVIIETETPSGNILKREYIEGTLIETESRETNLETKKTWEPLELINETIIKVLQGRVSEWCNESRENMTRYLRGSVRKRLINIKQELIETPVSFWDSPEWLQVPDTKNEYSTFKKDLFDMVLNAKLKNDKPLLNDKEKQMFILHYDKGETYPEIAKNMGSNPDVIRAELSRINKKIGRLPLREYFNGTLVSPSGTYFPKHHHDVSDIRECNLNPLRKYRVTKDIKDLERFRTESLNHLTYHKKHGAGTTTTINPKDYKEPKPFVFDSGSFDSKGVWENWVSAPIYNEWFSTGRNGGEMMIPLSTLWVEKLDKSLSFQRKPIIEKVVLRGRVRTRKLNPLNGNPYTKRDRIKHLITLALNRGNIPYAKTLREYLETLVPLTYSGKVPLPIGKLVPVEKKVNKTN